MNQLTLGSLFDGIGGFPYAASFYHIRPLWASEVAPSCISVTKRHFPEMEHLGDITGLRGYEIPPVDIITFGSPCQGLSIAGQRLGLADPRSGLFMEAIRIIREMRGNTHGEYPKLAVWENVPGSLSSAGGGDFKAVLAAFIQAKIPMPGFGRWANAGMVRGRGVDLAWCVYDAQYFGTAQRRRRLFLVADFTGQCAGEILFVPQSLRGYFEAGGTPRQGLAAYAEAGAEAAGGPGGQIALEVLNDQGGSSICVERAAVSPTLRSQTHGNLPVVALGFDLQQITSAANRSALKPVQPTLCGAGRPRVVCVSSGQANAAAMEDAAPTLTAAHERPFFAAAGFKYNASPAAGGIGYHVGQASTLLAGGGSGVLAADLFVRRITPVEAERLQGFPDGWTERGHDGRRLSDSCRYQMLGNSVAVPCVAYIMQGAASVLESRR